MSDTFPQNEIDTTNKVITLDGIQAIFAKSDNNFYDVSLNVNSQKFLIRFSDYWWSIADFEIISFKWFIINLTNSLIIALRNLIEVLRSKL